MASIATTDLIGVAGFLLYTSNYLCLQLGRIDGNGMYYPCINVVSASCVLISMVSSFNLASTLIQCTWIVVSLIGITRRLDRPVHRPRPRVKLVPLKSV